MLRQPEVNTVYSILKKAGKSSFEYVTKKPEADQMQAGVIYFYFSNVNKTKKNIFTENEKIQMQILYCCYLDAGNRRQLIDLEDLEKDVRTELEKFFQIKQFISDTTLDEINEFKNINKQPLLALVEDEKVSRLFNAGYKPLTDDQRFDRAIQFCLESYDSQRVLVTDEVSQAKVIHDYDSLRNRIYTPCSSESKVDVALTDRENLLTREMVQTHRLSDYFNVTSDAHKLEDIELAVVLINAKMGLSYDAEQLKNRGIVLALVSVYKDINPQLENVNQDEQPEQNNNLPDEPVAAKKSIFTYIKEKTFFYLKNYPITCGILIGLGFVVLGSLIAASIYLSGGAVIPVYAAAHFIGGAFVTGAVAGGIGAFLIGVKLAMVGVLLGGLGGAIAKCFINKEEPRPDEPVVVKSSSADFFSQTSEVGNTTGEGSAVSAKLSTTFRDKKVNVGLLFDASNEGPQQEATVVTPQKGNGNSM